MLANNKNFTVKKVHFVSDNLKKNGKNSNGYHDKICKRNAVILCMKRFNDAM